MKCGNVVRICLGLCPAYCPHFHIMVDRSPKNMWYVMFYHQEPMSVLFLLLPLYLQNNYPVLPAGVLG